MLLENGIHLDILLAHPILGTVAYCRMGGQAEWGEDRGKTFIGSATEPSDVAQAVIDRNYPNARQNTLKSRLWAFEQACDLLAKSYDRQHEYYQCDGVACRDRGSCPYCDGGLASCVKCKQAEGELEGYCNGYTTRT